MHSIKSSARREAWKSYDGDSRNYNPFARSTRGPRRPDDEEALHAVRTADSVPSQIETDRRNQNKDEYHHPNRAGTAPAGPGSDQSHSGVGHQAQHDEPHHLKEKDIGAVSPSTSERDMAEGPTDTSPSRAEEAPQTNGTPKQHGLRNRLVSKFHHDRTQNTSDDPEKKKKKKHKPIPVGKQLKAVFLGSWINLLLLAVPVSFAIEYAHVSGIANFVVSFIAIIPLASTLSFATEELALYVGQTLGGLLNASFGNATELIVSIIALAQHKIVIVQTSLIGSMLSNLLLVLGMCFFLGGLNRVKQHFNITVAQTAASLLALSIGSLIVPTAFVRFGTSTDSERTQAGVAPISRGTSVILLIVYGSYLLFQLKTHTDMYNEPSKKGQKRESSKKEKGDTLKSMARMGGTHAAMAGGSVNKENLVHNSEEDEEEEPTLSIVGALVTLTISTVLIAFCSEFMVSGIDAITGTGKISQEFVGLILIPIVGNAAEHATAITVAIKDKMDLAIGVAVGSSMQIALLVLPLMVIIGWCGLGENGDPANVMDLDFDGFQIAVLFIAVLLVNYLIQDGESHWLEGVMLMSTYVIIAVSAIFYPVSGEVAG